MASVTVALTGFDDSVHLFIIEWQDNVSLGAMFSTDGLTQTYDSIQIGYTGAAHEGRIVLRINGADFTPEFEATGRIIFTASDGEELEVTIGGVDMDEPYNWTPTNSVAVIAFADHVRTLADQNATLTLADTNEPDTPAAPTLSGTSNSITAVGIAPNDNGLAITSYDWRYKRTSTNIWGNRLAQTNLSQTFTNLEAEREYEVQFRATNSDGDSGYSVSGLFTTPATPPGPPLSYTNIPSPVAGDDWDLDDFKLWVVDNLGALHAIYTGATPGSTFALNQVVIGAAGGAFAGVALPNGALLLGSNAAPLALAVGSGTQRLRAINGVVQWVTV